MTKNDLKYAIKEIVYEMLDDNTCVNCGSLVDENLRKWFKDKWVNIGKKGKDGKHPPCGTSGKKRAYAKCCLLYTSPSPRDLSTSRMPSSA